MFKRLTKTYSENVPASLSLSHPWPSSEGTHVISCMCALPEIFVLASQDYIYSLPLSIWRTGFLSLTVLLIN